MNKKITIIAIFVLVVLLFGVGYLCYQKIARLEEQLIQKQEEIKFLQDIPKAEDILNNEFFAPGQVGENEADDVPNIIFNTIGVVQEVQQDRVIVLGDGSNFADKKPRQLTLLFTLETNVFLADKTQYIGLAGLEQLQPGMQLLINSVENMRGKTEFMVLNINVLDF